MEFKYDTRMSVEKSELDNIIKEYIQEVKRVLGENFLRACVYGSYARNQYSNESDIDIAIFTNIPSNEFYMLINQIAELTFEYNVKYDIILSPVFQNESEYKRMLNAVPYFQSIQKEGVIIGV